MTANVVTIAALAGPLVAEAEAVVRAAPIDEETGQSGARAYAKVHALVERIAASAHALPVLAWQRHHDPWSSRDRFGMPFAGIRPTPLEAMRDPDHVIVVLPRRWSTLLERIADAKRRWTSIARRRTSMDGQDVLRYLTVVEQVAAYWRSLIGTARCGLLVHTRCTGSCWSDDAVLMALGRGGSGQPRKKRAVKR